MPVKRKYVFQVEVEFVGPEQDFEWFFNARRQKMEYDVKRLSCKTEDLTDEEKQPKTDHDKAKKFIRACLKKGGFVVVKNTWYHEDRSKLPANAVTISKQEQSFIVQTADYGYNRLQLFYNGPTLRHSFKKYKVVDGGLGVEDYDETVQFKVDDDASAERLTSLFKQRFLSKSNA